jgi:hypothetical protein
LEKFSSLIGGGLQSVVKAKVFLFHGKPMRINGLRDYACDYDEARCGLKRLGRNIWWSAFAGMIALLVCVAAGRAFAQTQTEAQAQNQTQAQAQQLADAEAALAQAQADAKNHIDCGGFSGIARTVCNHGAAAQVSAHNKRVADAQKLVQQLRAEAAQQKDDARRDAATAQQQAPSARSSAVTQPVAEGDAAASSHVAAARTTEREVGAGGVGNRYDIAKGGLFVQVPGSYPQGYGPAWALNSSQRQPIATNRHNFLPRTSPSTETLFVRITDDQGRPVVEFSRRAMEPCDADISGLPQVITSSPQQFRLTNFRFANSGLECQRGRSSTTPWQGSITLSANANGDLSFSLVLDLALPSGEPWYEFTSQTLPFVNQMTAETATVNAAAAAAATAKHEAGMGGALIITKEYAAAAPHLSAACDGGSAEGCYNLGQLYDEAAGVPQDKARAAILFDKGCEGGIVSSCLRAGDVYAGGKGVAADKDKQLKYYREGCQGVGQQVGQLEGCEHWATLQPGADKEWVASVLTNDPNVGSTLKEQSLVISDPRAMGQLCSAHTERACFVLLQTIDGLHFSDVVGDPDRHFTRASLLPVQVAMRDICKQPVTGPDPREHNGYCRVSNMVDYAIVHTFGPASADPTRCVRIAGTYTTTDYYWVDQNGHKTFKNSSYSPSGTDVQNDCAYAVDFADFAGDVVTIHSHELYKANLDLGEILTNMNAPKVRYIKKH